MKKLIFMGIIAGLLAACSKDDPPPPVPGETALVFPENNSLCVTGIPQSETTSEVTFRWQAATDADSYELLVTALGSSGVQRQITTGLSLSVVLEKGAPYSWQVTSINQQSREETPSQVWQFFNAGAEVSYPPFPARLLEPSSGASVLPDAVGEIQLRWELADPDNDLERCEVYLGTDPDDLPLHDVLGPTAVNLQVLVESDTVYYWQILIRSH
ncbi:MAG: hypothetical protein P8Z38_11680 [Robiginitalea sp.]